MSEPQLDPEAVKRYAFSVWSFKQGEMVSLMIHLGDRLGLYQALSGAGPVTAREEIDFFSMNRFIRVRNQTLSENPASC